MDAFPFPSRELAREELEQDIIYNKLVLAGADIDAIVERAWQTGAEAARVLYTEMEGQADFQKIADKKGLSVIREHKDNVQAGRRYFSEYYTGKKKLTLYTGSIALWAKKNNMTVQQAENLVLAHEFFHYLENTSLGRTSKQATVPMLTIFGIPLGKTGVRALSEIGAHAFARTYNELSGKPKNKRKQ